MIQDNKINHWEHPISNEQDRPQRTAREMKEVFDSNTNELKAALNAVIDALAGEGGTGEIGSGAVGDIEPGPLKTQLDALRGLIDQRIANITIGTVYTGPPGEQAYVWVDGTPPNIELNFMLPRGDNGDPTAAHAYTHSIAGNDKLSPGQIGAQLGRLMFEDVQINNFAGYTASGDEESELFAGGHIYRGY